MTKHVLIHDRKQAHVNKWWTLVS